MSDLPAGWVEKKIGDVFEFTYGKSLPDRVRSGKGFPVYGSNGIVGYHDKPLTSGETVIIGRKGSVGEVNYSPTPCFPIDTTYYIDQFQDLSPKFWFYLLKSSNLGRLNKATAIPGLNRNDAYDIDIPVPPLDEQKRIAEKLDSLLTRVDSCQTHLERVPQILKRFRQSVLAAATSGGLLDAENSGAENSLQLSEVIERLKTGPFGSTLHKSDYVTNGVPLVNPTHINNGRITPSNEVTITEKMANELQEFRLTRGDVVLARRGVMGRCAVVTKKEEGWMCGSGSMLLHPTEKVLPEYLQMFLSSPTTVANLEADSVGSTMSNLNQKILLNLTIHVPSIEEQAEIVRRVEKLFAYAERLEARTLSASERVARLTPSLLAKAFRGELVPPQTSEVLETSEV